MDVKKKLSNRKSSFVKPFDNAWWQKVSSFFMDILNWTWFPLNAKTLPCKSLLLYCTMAYQEGWRTAESTSLFKAGWDVRSTIEALEEEVAKPQNGKEVRKIESAGELCIERRRQSFSYHVTEAGNCLVKISLLGHVAYSVLKSSWFSC